MGQQTSREHAPLTFGYVNRTIPNISKEEDRQELDQAQRDFVLDNPHLYQLQTICDQCSKENTVNRTEEMVVSLVNESCAKCKRQKRLSLVRKGLAEDLEYIDQTYYPDVVHYTEEDDQMEQELIQLENNQEDDTNNWSRLTIGEATSPSGSIASRRRPRRLTGPSSSMAVDLSHRSLVKLGPSIGYLSSLTKLNLSNNQMMSLPREIGYLKNLRVLNISNNAIEDIPNTITFLTKLKALNVSYNKLVQLPSSIGNLPKLVIIIANDNKLTSLPREFAHLTNLISLNVSNNPLKSLPAEIATLSNLRKLLTEDCSFEEEYSYSLKHDPPSLFETCARIAVRSQLSIPHQLSEHIKDYLARADTCSYCKGPFFDSFVSRVRFIERRFRQPMALEYTLCRAHWSTDEDRLLCMFSEQQHTTQGTTVDMEGLNEVVHRHRAHSDASNTSVGSSNVFLTPPAPPLISQPSFSSRRSNSNASEYPPTTDYFPISLLKSQPDLPALPLENTNMASSPSSSSSLLTPPPLATNIRGNRPRASSATSVTKRFTNFIRSNSSSSLTRERSTSGSSLLRPYHQPTQEKVLRDWTDSVQVAAAAAVDTVQQQQDQIEDLVMRNMQRPTLVSSGSS
ncbi:uncharacterized protein B0P05DRAFT_572949 [Gilbertella persicaria]|uniref:uncharacterized protein n=1 Tax=Gilbertella persicaria TaxID=101096 RepID=UPI00221FAB4D|nr:uncharacterized protein B0P05DRAFT_572949 [Gilbertella persicaria]KAI8073394.1 hypothetical protein B0P05DRAFT_572949 [Gilbertella persicaria]